MAWAPDYTESAELKEYTKAGDDVADGTVALAITAASRAVDQHCNRQFGLIEAPELRTYTARWDSSRGRYVVDIDDLMTDIGLEVEGASAITDHQLWPLNAAAKGMPWTRLVIGSGGRSTEGGISVTARFGWSAVPTAIKQATLLQASRLLKRTDAPFGVAGSVELGSEMRLLAKVDPDVAVTLTAYRRRRAVA